MKKSDANILMLDVDGVVVDGRPDRRGGWQSDLEIDLGSSSAALSEHFFKKYWPAIVTGQRELVPDLASALGKMGSTVSAEELIDYWFRQDSWIDQSVLYDVDQLRKIGVMVWLATNQDHLRARYLMDNLGLAKHVDGIVYSAQLGVAKPDDLFFRRAAAFVGGSEKLLVDDTMANVVAARRAG